MVNEAFCRLFGVQSVGDAIGRTEDEILPPDVLERSQRGLRRLLAGESFVEEESIRHGAENILVTTQRFRPMVIELLSYNTLMVLLILLQSMWMEAIRNY